MTATTANHAPDAPLPLSTDDDRVVVEGAGGAGRVVRIDQLSKTFKSRGLGGGGVAPGLRGVGQRMWRAVARGRRTIVEAVKDLSFDIERGEVFGLLGPNGSGKSTTIKMMLGLLAPTAGVIEVLGQPPHDRAVKHRIGFLPEESYLYRFLTADETLDFYGKLFGMPRAARREKADVLIKRVGLDHARRRPVREYSKGMARRLGLAQALINDPELVILDEPTTGLDPIGTAEMNQLIRELKAEGRTVLLCSHLLADVQEVCDRVAVMCDGDLLALGTLTDLLRAADRTEAEFPTADAGFQRRLHAFAESEGFPATRIDAGQDRLTHLFLRLIDEKDPTRIPAIVRPQLFGTAPPRDARSGSATSQR